MMKNKFFWLLTIVIIILGILVDFRIDEYNKQSKESDIIRIANTLSVAVSYEDIEKLDGDSTDLQKANYWRLKEQLTRVLDKNPKYRFIYLMRKINGKVIFLADNQSSENSKLDLDSNLASAGELYEDATKTLISVFEQKETKIEGPEKDRWGVFYSGLAPITNPKTGKLIGVLGVDILEGNWNEKRLFQHLSVWTITLLLLSLLLFLFRYMNRISLHQQAIQASQKRFMDISSLSTDWIWEVDMTGTYSFCSPKIKEILGYEMHEVMGKTAFDFIAAEDLERCREYFIDIIAKKAPLVGLVHFCITKDNRKIVIESNGIPTLDSHGKMTGYRGYDKDITQKLMYENHLLEAKVAAENANKAKSEFLANMSHEIRTPINGIMGMTELALLSRLTDTQREYLESIQYSAYSLLDVINDILDFSKIEAGKLEIEEIAFDVRDMVENTVPIISAKCLEKNVELLCSINPNIPQIIISDSIRLKQVLINLLSNAIKFTQQGEILVTLEVQIIDGISWVVFTVKDTGIGIPASKYSKIFESFSQADSSTTRKYGGSGLGLTISKSLIDLMGGTIWVESTLEKGSLFGFRIPLKTEIETHLIFEPIALKHILVVDDNATNLRIIHEMLNWFGIQNTTINSAKEALTYLKEHPNTIDTIIVDHQMPDMDGVELVDYIRTNIEFERTPYMMMFSSSNRESISNKTGADGVQYYLTKPVRMKDLHAILQNISGKQIQLQNEPIAAKLPEFVVQGEEIILVAEDNPINMKIIRLILKMGGYHVIEAVNGEEAIEKNKLAKPNLIFMDIHMPAMDGLTATTRIRAMETDNRVPIIALTADAMTGDKEKCLEVGMDDYVTKPFKQKEIYAMIVKYLDK